MCWTEDLLVDLVKSWNIFVEFILQCCIRIKQENSNVWQLTYFYNYISIIEQIENYHFEFN